MRLVTERLLLREMEERDILGLFEMESIPEVVRYQNFGPRSLENARAYVFEAMEAQGEKRRSYFELTVCPRADEACMMGRVGAVPGDGATWVWYAFHPDYQGQGFAREAMGAFIPALLDAGLPEPIQIECDPLNVRSWRLAESLGFQLISDTPDALIIRGQRVGSRLYRLF